MNEDADADASTPRECSDDGFCHTALPKGQTLRAVWGDGQGVVWAVSGQGAILRWDQTEWKIHASGLGLSPRSGAAGRPMSGSAVKRPLPRYRGEPGSADVRGDGEADGQGLFDLGDERERRLGGGWSPWLLAAFAPAPLCARRRRWVAVVVGGHRRFAANALFACVGDRRFRSLARGPTGRPAVRSPRPHLPPPTWRVTIRGRLGALQSRGAGDGDGVRPR